MADVLSFFAQQGWITEPGPYTGSLDSLPTDIAGLCELVQGTTVHVFWAERYGIELTSKRQSEVQLRTIQRRLSRIWELDPRPLTEARPAEKRIVGNCRDFSVLLVSILRHQGIPARARCGFAAYFTPGHFEDHWVAEYWHSEQQRWILVDAQLDSLQYEVLKIPFNPLDVPRDQFIVGGRAWQMCRKGQADPDSFGIFDMHGLGFVRGDFIRDVASLNKVELLPWDCWGIIEKSELGDPTDLAFLDRLAGMTSGDVPDFETVRDLYQSDARLRVDSEIHSYGSAGMEIIEIPK
jgi:Transglutaminase-like superfamily